MGEDFLTWCCQHRPLQTTDKVYEVSLSFSRQGDYFNNYKKGLLQGKVDYLVSSDNTDTTNTDPIC